MIARIRQVRRSAGPQQPPASSAERAKDDRVRALEGRLTHLEQLLQGLQDSVYRESQRQDKRIAELEKRIDPAALGKALSNHARERGL
jgi:uncharacterized coiled-coil protein SlyX